MWGWPGTAVRASIMNQSLNVPRPDSRSKTKNVTRGVDRGWLCTALLAPSGLAVYRSVGSKHALFDGPFARLTQLINI